MRPTQRFHIDGADTIVIGDRNVLRTITDLRISRPAVTFSSALASPAAMRSFGNFVKNPDSYVRRAALRRALRSQDNRRPYGPVRFGTLDGLTRLASYPVSVRSSRGVVVADYHLQTSHFKYKVEDPPLSLDEVAAYRPAVADAVIRLVAQPEDDRCMQALTREARKAVGTLGHEQWVPLAARAEPELRRPAGVTIGRANQTINTGSVRVDSIDVSGAVEAIRGPASDAVETARLDAEYAALRARLDGPAPSGPCRPVNDAVASTEAIANRERFREVQTRRLERLRDDPTATRWGRSRIASARAQADVAITELTARLDSQLTAPEVPASGPTAPDPAAPDPPLTDLPTISVPATGPGPAGAGRQLPTSRDVSQAPVRAPVSSPPPPSRVGRSDDEPWSGPPLGGGL